MAFCYCSRGFVCRNAPDAGMRNKNGIQTIYNAQHVNACSDVYRNADFHIRIQELISKPGIGNNGRERTLNYIAVLHVWQKQKKNHVTSTSLLRIILSRSRSSLEIKFLSIFLPFNCSINMRDFVWSSGRSFHVGLST
jgi:hypothetical protein